MHTPVASLLTRLAAVSIDRRVRPKLVYTAHGFHFHAHGSTASNFFYGSLERLAGIWTDRLVVTNEEVERAARSRSIARPGSMRFIPGVGVDLDIYRPTEDTGSELGSETSWGSRLRPPSCSWWPSSTRRSVIGT